MKVKDLKGSIRTSREKSIGDLASNLSAGLEEQPNFSLFLGAGASSESGIPTAGELVKDWRTEKFHELSKIADTLTDDVIIEWLVENQKEWYNKDEEYSVLIKRKYPLPKPRQIFIESLVAGKVPSIGYAYLMRLVERHMLTNIFTTNFDDLLNEAFYQFSDQRPIVSAHDSSLKGIGVTKARPKIIKLHGDYLFDSIKNTSKETGSLSALMEDKLKQFCREFGLIVCGYSGMDKSVMKVIDTLLDDDECLENGLYWCFRSENSFVSPKVYELLEKDKIFYVLTGSFNEMMADLYSRLVGKAPPISAELDANRSARFVTTYLEDQTLKVTKNKTISEHLTKLKKTNHRSLIAEAMAALNEESFNSHNLSDDSILLFLEVEKLLASRSPELAFEKLRDTLSGSVEEELKQPLLMKAFECAIQIGLITEARKLASDVYKLDPRNFYIALNIANLIEDEEDRLQELRKLADTFLFSANVRNALADETCKRRYMADCSVEKALEIYTKSTEIDPSLSNPAWRGMFNIRLEQVKSAASVKRDLEGILEKYLNQRPYSRVTSRLLFQYCRHCEDSIYNGRPITSYLADAYENHFPRDEVSHIQILSDVCAEFGEFAALRKILKEAMTDSDLIKSEEFTCHLMSIHYRVFRDLPKSIEIGEEYLKDNDSKMVETKLFRHLIDFEGDFSRAESILDGLKGSIHAERHRTLEAQLLEHKGLYQDAIDLIEATPDRRNFLEENASTLSFLEMKQGNYRKAFLRCKELLEQRGYKANYGNEIINLEFSKFKSDSKKRPKKARVESVQKVSSIKSIEAACEILIGDPNTALEILEKESEKDFSKLVSYIRMPIFEVIRDKLIEKRGLLENSRRSLGTIGMEKDAVEEIDGETNDD